MGRHKNAERQHLVAPINETNPETAPEEFLALETYITNIEAANTEESDAVAYYHGDGTPEQEVRSIAKGYNVTGDRYYGDPAQDLIAEMEGKLGEGRKLWHKIIRADGKKEYVGIATASEIIPDGGEAGTNEAFGCTITFDRYPEVTDIVPGG